VGEDKRSKRKIRGGWLRSNVLRHLKTWIPPTEERGGKKSVKTPRSRKTTLSKDLNKKKREIYSSS